MPRIFLVVVDESEELKVALRYACRRARRTGGRVALLYVIDTDDDGQWMGVKELMREERRAEAEALLTKVAAEVEPLAGSLPVVYIREGRRRDALLELIDEDPSISILVLATSTSPMGRARSSATSPASTPTG